MVGILLDSKQLKAAAGGPGRSLPDVFDVVGSQPSHQARLHDRLDAIHRRLGAALVEAGLEVEVKDVIAQVLAARAGLDPREVDVPLG
ncbi:MAG: hypothetical protein ACI9PP_000821 [Halobacteriales archaeon]|jgi:hypothetical protein